MERILTIKPTSRGEIQPLPASERHPTILAEGCWSPRSIGLLFARTRATRGAGSPACSPRPPALHLELARKVEGLPRDLGWTLIGLGAVGIAIPGPIPPGTSFVLLGALFLRPSLLAKFAGPLARRFPKLFRFLIGFVDDLRADLERRYPGCVRC